MALNSRPALPVATTSPNLTARLFPATPHGPIAPATADMLRAVGFSRLMRVNMLMLMLMKLLCKHLRHLLFSTMDNVRLPLTA